MKLESALYIVATPIGNLGDISFRAVEILKNVDIIAAEDTRHSARLMQHLDIGTPMMAYHDYSSDFQIDKIVSALEDGKRIALISDAGTPLISDPGFRLVRCIREKGFTVVPVPGACAVIAALCASGLPSDRFSFEGFSPAKSAARRAIYDNVKLDARTLVYYESPHRILDSLEDMLHVFGDERRIVLAREITKTYETFLDGCIGDVLDKLRADENQQRGEMVILIAGYDAPKEVDISPETEHMMRILLDELPVKQAASLVAKITGDKKNKLYQWALKQ